MNVFTSEKPDDITHGGHSGFRCQPAELLQQVLQDWPQGTLDSCLVQPQQRPGGCSSSYHTHWPGARGNVRPSGGMCWLSHSSCFQTPDSYLRAAGGRTHSHGWSQKSKTELLGMSKNLCGTQLVPKLELLKLFHRDHIFCQCGSKWAELNAMPCPIHPWTKQNIVTFEWKSDDGGLFSWIWILLNHLLLKHSFFSLKARLRVILWKLQMMMFRMIRAHLPGLCYFNINLLMQFCQNLYRDNMSSFMDLDSKTYN